MIERLWSSWTQHLIARNGVAQGGSEKNVRRKMGTRGHAREADSCCETVREPGHPAVVLITAGDNSGDRKNPGGVPGREGAALEGRLAAAKERVVKRPSGSNICRPFSAGNRFDRKVDDRAVGIG